jgi:hypothetical protein
MENEVKEFPTSKTMKCKLGSHAATVVRVDMRQKFIKVKNKIRVYEVSHNKWSNVYVTKIYDNGFFFAVR